MKPDESHFGKEKGLSYNLQFSLHLGTSYAQQSMTKGKQDRNSRNWKAKAGTKAEIQR